MKALSEEMTEPVEQVDELFERIDARLDKGFAAITEQLVEQRARTEFVYERLDKSLHSLSGGISRLERKLDRILALSVESHGRNRW